MSHQNKYDELSKDFNDKEKYNVEMIPFMRNEMVVKSSKSQKN